MPPWPSSYAMTTPVLGTTTAALLAAVLLAALLLASLRLDRPAGVTLLTFDVSLGAMLFRIQGRAHGAHKQFPADKRCRGMLALSLHACPTCQCECKRLTEHKRLPKHRPAQAIAEATTQHILDCQNVGLSNIGRYFVPQITNDCRSIGLHRHSLRQIHNMCSIAKAPVYQRIGCHDKIDI